MNITQELERLEQLRSKGALSDTEFQSAKSSLLSESEKPPQKPPLKPAGGMIYGLEEKTWCTLMHMSQLLNFSGIGIGVPIVMWVLGKEKSEMVTQQGNRMMNWIISSFIYGAIGSLLCFVFIGIPILLCLAVLILVFPIIAALKANENKVWTYPLTIKFLPEN